jgi:hemolysin activation/secretion protein
MATVLAVLVGRATLVVAAEPQTGQPTSIAGPTMVPPAPKFDVQEYRVLGNTLLPARDIERLLYPLLGEHKQLTDLQAARAALEKLYHDRGFGTVFVDIPPQEVQDGIVRLHVTEATLRTSKIDGARYFSERDVIAALPAAQVGSAPNLTVLQQQLADLNSQTSDRSVVPVLKAGPVPGTLDLELKVHDQLPLHGTVELDDNYTTDTRPLRAAVGLSYGNLFQALDAVSVQYQASPQSLGEVSVLNAGYTSRPFDNGYRASGYFISSNSNVASVGAEGIGVLGKGQIAGLRLSVPSIDLKDSTQAFSLGIDFKHFRNAISEGGATEPLVTPISYFNASVAYVGSWHWSHVDWVINVAPNFGVRAIRDNAAEFENDRYLARPDYAYVRWDGTLTWRLPAEYRMTLRLAGQETDEPLVSNENYSIGGIDGVRGYLEAEELGDSALKGTLQLQTPTWSWHVPQLFNLFAFLDAGRIHVFDPLAGETDGASLESFGAGFNLLPTRPYNAILTWADPLKIGTYTRKHQSRVLFSVRGAF